MGDKKSSWWQNIRQHPFIVAGIIVVIFALTAFAIAVIKFGWDWTGFNGGYGKITNHTPAKDTELPPARTLWDWLQLLIIPLVLAVAALLFNRATTRAEQKIAAQRYEQDQQIALDKQHEDLLQAYLDRMSELLLEKDLRTKPSEEVKNVARVRTITVLTQLDARRIGYVFTFLREAGLMSTTSSDNVVSLKDADLHAVKWSHADLRGVNLSGANLNGADLSGANLDSAHLNGANLYKANLSGAILFGASLERANLKRANLYEAGLIETILYKANLSGAGLSEAGLTQADLKNARNITIEELEKQAKSLEGATMPDGSIHP